MPYAVNESARPLPLVYTHKDRMKNIAGAENPRPITPMAFANSDACVITKSICLIAIRGSKKLLRSVGRANKTRADTSACNAMARLTVAKGHCRVREVYCGRRTLIPTAKPLSKNTRRTVNVGSGTANRVIND